MAFMQPLRPVEEAKEIVASMSHDTDHGGSWLCRFRSWRF